jgi:hypothetical protein
MSVWKLAGTMLILVGLLGCGEEPGNPDATNDYATGALPTADSVQRDSELHMAQGAGERDEARTP